MRVEAVTGPVVVHGEGPVWWDGWGGLRWVDMLAGDVLTLDEAGRVDRRHVGEVAAAARPRRGGGAVLGIERGFALEDVDGSVRPLPPVWTDRGVRMNEGGCDPQGRFYCGSLAVDRTPGAGSLYRLDPDLTTTVVLRGVSTSNGLDWSPDGTLAYYVDTPTRRIDVFDHDPVAGPVGRRPFVAVEGTDGGPDGLTVDAEGGVWVALHRGGAVRRYTADGVLDAVVALPTPKVTACTFGGPDLDRLYVTTSRVDIDPDDDPLAGCLFVVDGLGVRGQPARTFAG